MGSARKPSCRKKFPAPTRAHMAAPCGLLVHELINCPAPLADSAEELLTLSLELDTDARDGAERAGRHVCVQNAH